MKEIIFNNICLKVVRTDDYRQWYMPLEEVASAYGVTRRAVQQVIDRHSEEIREGIERGSTVCSTPGGDQLCNVLFREGVIKVGFFMRGDRAKAFRQFATNLVTDYLSETKQDSQEGFTRFITYAEKRFDKIEDICRGFRDEIDELRATLNLLISEDDEKMIRNLIRRIKDKYNCDGRTVVGKVRATLNVGSIYETPDTRKVINTLRNLLGEGLTLVKEEQQNGLLN
jgi:hypothetical protein